MMNKPSIFEILIDDKESSVDNALLAALAVEEMPTTKAIVETLLARNTRVGLHGLLAMFHDLDESLKQMVLCEIDRLFSVLREASGSRTDQVRLNVLDLIRRGRVYRASYLLDAALHDRSARIRETAAETLCYLADELLKTAPTYETNSETASLVTEDTHEQMVDLESYREDRRQLAGALEAGLTSFSIHLQPCVIKAAMWYLGDLEEKFWANISVPQSRALHAALGIFNSSKSPRLAPFAIKALSHGPVRSHVSKVLTTCTDPEFITEWVGQSWRIAQPKIAKGMLVLKELACVLESVKTLLQMNSNIQRHIPRWVVATGIGEEYKINLLRDIYSWGDRQVKRSVVWALTFLDSDQAVSLLRTIAYGDEPEFAKIARYELTTRRPLEFPLNDLISSPEKATSPGSVSNKKAGPMTFERYWEMFDQLSENNRVRIGKDLLTQKARLKAHISRKLIDNETYNRVRALRMITVLKIAEEFADQLYRLSHDLNSAVRSATISALSRLPNATSRRILRNAMNDQDARVQANAVEAVEKLGMTSIPSELLAKLSSQNNRVRANAVKALLKMGVREAAEALLYMLMGQQRDMKISALWLIEHMALFPLAERVIKLADSDEDIQVRAKAKVLAERLLNTESATLSETTTKSETAPIC